MWIKMGKSDYPLNKRLINLLHQKDLLVLNVLLGFARAAAGKEEEKAAAAEEEIVPVQGAVADSIAAAVVIAVVATLTRLLQGSPHLKIKCPVS
jgi:hypothetical protein